MLTIWGMKDTTKHKNAPTNRRQKPWGVIFLWVCFMFKLKENQEQRHRKCSFNFSGAQFACVFDLVKFKHRDCVSQLTEFTETLKLVKLKRIIHLEMKIRSLPTLMIFSCGTRKEMFCIMCELHTWYKITHYTSFPITLWYPLVYLHWMEKYSIQ